MTFTLIILTLTLTTGRTWKIVWKTQILSLFIEIRTFFHHVEIPSIPISPSHIHIDLSDEMRLSAYAHDLAIVTS
jgi:hypothetical protein